MFSFILLTDTFLAWIVSSKLVTCLYFSSSQTMTCVDVVDHFKDSDLCVCVFSPVYTVHLQLFLTVLFGK